MAGYTRVDTSNNIADGNVISAADLDNEFDGIQAAFNASTGHNHDGTTGEGAPILVLGPTQDVVIGASTVTPKTTNTVDIGSSSLKFKDLYLAGNASIGGTLGVTGATTLSAALTYGGVTLSNAVTGTGNMVLSASPTLTGTLSGANASLSGTLAVTGVATLTAQPILSSLTASRAVFTDGSKGLVSNAITGTGNVVMSASPTLTGTITAEALTLSGDVTASAGTANGIAYLNGSKVLTTGSALTFDGTNLTASGYIGAGSYLNVSGAAGYISFSGGGTASAPAGLSYGSFLNSGVGLVNFSAASQAFWANSTEQMRLTSTGLGIGTSSPTNKLSVTGNANITGNTTLGDASTDTVTVNGYMGVGGAANSAGAVTISSAALTGVNQFGVVASPVGSAAATTSIRGISTQPSTSATAFTVTDVAGYWAANPVKGAGSTITNAHGVLVGDHAAGTNNYGITSLVSSGTNKWNIYASGTAANYFAGNVGIGTSSPGATLDVVAFSTNAQGLRVRGRSSDNIGGVLFTDNDGATQRGFLQSRGDNEMRLYAGTGGANGVVSAYTANVERLRIDSSGYVGIGTSSPTSRLHVSTSATGVAQFTGPQYGQIRHSDGTRVLYTQVYDNQARLFTETATPLLFGTNNTERMRIDSSGNLIQTVNTTAATLATNNTLTFSIVDNSTLRISVRGSDGTTRTATIALT